MKKADYSMGFSRLNMKPGSLAYSVIYLNSLGLCFLIYKLGITLPYSKVVANFIDTMIKISDKKPFRMHWILSELLSLFSSSVTLCRTRVIFLSPLRIVK